MKWIRQTIRGCGTLPHVGRHPGNEWMAVFVGAGSLAGSAGGWIGAAVGAGVMLIWLGPIYLRGAYEAAELSDKLVAAEDKQ